MVLVVLLGYSYMKRFTRWSHLVLGLALGLGAICGLDRRPRHRSIHASWCSPRLSRSGWAASTSSTPARTSSTTASAGLHSLPQAIGIPSAFLAARIMHLAMLGLLVWFGMLFHFHVAGWLGIAAVGLLAGL